jgi:PAS domain S-box-containing protein
MIGWGWQKVHHPDHVQRILEISKKIWHIPETFELTFPLRRHDGAYRWFLTRGHPVINEEGKIIRWIGTNTDINEQKKAEEQFKVLADQVPMWVWLTDKEVNVIYANPDLLRFIGITHYTEFTGHIWEQKVHPDDVLMVYGAFAEAVSLQQSFSIEFRVQNAMNNQYEWFFLKAVPRVEDGEFTGFIGTGINLNEQKLILSQLEYRTALLEAHNESSIDGILLVDTKGKILSHNHRFVEIWNMPQQVVDDKDDDKALEFALTQLDNPEHFIDRVKWLYEHPHVRSIDELEFKDGKIIERHGYPVAAADGSYFAWSWMFRDITEQRKSEKELKESEEKFRLLADSMPQHIWTSDPEGNLNYYNQSVFEFSGLNLEQINKGGWIQIVHPDDREQNMKQWIEAITTGKDFICEHRFRRHDGEYRWQLSRAIPQRDANGKIQRWVGTSTDIQEQKTFAKALEEIVFSRTAALKSSEEKFYILFNLSPICKILSDVQTGKIVMVNDAFTNLLGYSREELYAKTSAELGMLDPTQREILANEIKKHGKITNIEVEYTKKSGERFIALTSAEIITLEDTKYFLGAFSDISDRKKAENNIEQKNIELERMNKELQSFAYISSHDLQEPLRKIQTFATRVIEKEENNLSDYGKDMISRMQDAAKRMQTLIQDLLAYSRTNTPESKFETADLNIILAEVKEDLKEELKEKNATVEAAQLCDAYIIPFQFRQLLHNLIGNSLKFSNPDHPPRITIRCEIAKGINFNNEKLIPQNKYCHITVSDNGIGFEPQYSEKIFEVFQRLHSRNEYIGTGIGLSIVKKIVENHHGIITATGELNKGATFDIYIPAT